MASCLFTFLYFTSSVNLTGCFHSLREIIYIHPLVVLNVKYHHNTRYYLYIICKQDKTLAKATIAIYSPGRKCLFLSDILSFLRVWDLLQPRRMTPITDKMPLKTSICAMVTILRLLLLLFFFFYFHYILLAIYTPKLDR